MDLKEIKQIIEIMKRSDLTEFEIEEEGFKLRICRAGGHPIPTVITPPTSPPFATVVETTPMSEASAVSADIGNEAFDEDAAGTTFIKSPMVGTFYRAPSPESPPFVEVEHRLQEDTVVCIIEAMKVMNEIQAETTGIVAEALVENGSTVEYGQPLFKVARD